ncbi:MAG: hypothetical protein SLAVMIC_00148 [uncultured marine phage]|uniref:Uncharacterized protein n=1 Tax=uncultured marine phage TaxID=707152 RepID=A0A8D9FPZ8_9VIRU|nr:MAG: hypothetical protein SLAVMIC_00148 [uncultured marine phage]
MNKEELLRQSILTAHQKNEENGRKYHVLNDQFYTIVEDDYFQVKRTYFSLYNTEDKEYSKYKVEYSGGELIIENK